MIFKKHIIAISKTSETLTIDVKYKTKLKYVFLYILPEVSDILFNHQEIAIKRNCCLLLNNSIIEFEAFTAYSDMYLMVCEALGYEYNFEEMYQGYKRTKVGEDYTLFD